MRSLPGLCCLLLTAVATAQGLRLDALVARPLAHVEITSGEARDTAAEDRGAGSGEAVARGTRVPSFDLGLLDEPALGAIVAAFGQESGGRSGARKESALSSVPALATIRQLARLSTGELEFAVVALLPRRGAADLPLLVGRLALSERGQDALHRSLEERAFAAESRRVADVAIYELGGRAERRAGSVFELAVVGDDLLVANHGATLDDILRRAQGGQARTSTDRAQAESLLRDEVHTRLVARLHGQRGAATRGERTPTGGAAHAVVSLDWASMGPRMMRDLGPGERLAMYATGLATARRVVIGIREESGSRRDRPVGLRTTVLIDQPQGAGGLLAAATTQSLRRLVQNVPTTALASLTVSLDPRRLADDVRAVSGELGFGPGLIGGCRSVGLDFESQVRPRLGDAASCRVVLLRGGSATDPAQVDAKAGSAAGGACVALSVATKSDRAAVDLCEDLAAAFARSGFTVSSAPLFGRDRRGPLCWTVSDPGRRSAALAPIGAAVVCALDHPSVAEVAEQEVTTSRMARARHRSDTLDIVEALTARGEHRADARASVAVFDLDAREVQSGGARHAGLVVLDDDAIRIEVLTPR